MMQMQPLGVKGTVELVARNADGEVIARRMIENLITNVGLAFLAGDPTGDTDMTTMKYIAIGTGVAAAAAADTTLGTEIETRAVGVQTRVTTTVANDTYQAVGTVSITGTHAVTECGLLSANAVGTLGARQVFAALNLVNGDTLELTWKWKFANA